MKRFGAVIVGDEILSGRRADKHLAKIIALLGERGLALSWAEYVGDDRDAIAAVLARTMAGDDVVFVTGGIGATPDDQTRQAAAQAKGVGIALHPEAAALIRRRIDEMNATAAHPVPVDSPEHRQRMRMGEFPVGADIIPNAYNRIPGFRLDDHHFVPGFPVMAWPMIAWTLDTHYASLFHRDVRAERAVLVFDAPESRVTPLMEAIERDDPSIRVFSLPSVGDPTLATDPDPRVAMRAERHIELGVKGPADRVDGAFRALQRALDALDVRYVRIEGAACDDDGAPVRA